MHFFFSIGFTFCFCTINVVLKPETDSNLEIRFFLFPSTIYFFNNYSFPCRIHSLNSSLSFFSLYPSTHLPVATHFPLSFFPCLQVASYEAKKGEFDKCLLLYSGGLDTSVMLKWIQDSYNSKVVALTINIGQTSDNLEEIRLKALKLGAVDAIVVDAREEFADELLSEAIMANADYQGGYALGCPLGRVMISKIAVREAKKHG